MIHQFRDKKQIAKKKRLIKNIIFLVVFLLIASSGFFAYTTSFFHIIGRPIWKAKDQVENSLNSLKSVVRTKSSVYKENEKLLEDNANLRAKMVDYELVKNDNINLKDLLGRTTTPSKFILANILTKPNYSPYDTIIVDIGSLDGISVGNQVYANEVTPIGDVTAVYTNSSLITLYSNPGEVTEAMMDGSNTSVELVGRGGGNFEMTIPIDLTFVKGGIVYLPNMSSEIVAIIEDVISRPNDPIKKLLLSSPVNIQSLKWVLIKK